VANLVLLVVCFFLGVIAKRSGALPSDSHRAVNAWLMLVSLPALVFKSIHGAVLEPVLLGGAALVWLGFAVPAVVAWRLVQRGAERGPAGAVALCAGLPNTAFVGFPLLEALGGKEALGPAAVIDQLGAFLALFLMAIPFATALGGGEVSLGRSLARLVRAPAMVALMLALALRGVEVPEWANLLTTRLGDMLSPLALASVGWQLDLKALEGNGRRVALGLSWKLVFAPLVALGVILVWRGSVGPLERIIIAQTAMAPMVASGVVAAEHRLSPSLASAMIAAGVPLSLLTVPLWWWLLG